LLKGGFEQPDWGYRVVGGLLENDEETKRRHKELATQSRRTGTEERAQKERVKHDEQRSKEKTDCPRS
jgi:hypothetical protein